jgi:nuclear pore complex protein Nup98-Nup96
VDIIKGLDWKWAFGVHLWFFELVDVPIAHVFSAYNQENPEIPVSSDRPRLPF